MADGNEKKPLGLKGKLSLNRDLSDIKKAESKNHGVTVQVKRKRVSIPTKRSEEEKKDLSSRLEEKKIPESSETTSGRKLTHEEWEARMRVLQQAEKTEEELSTRRKEGEEHRKKLYHEQTQDRINKDLVDNAEEEKVEFDQSDKVDKAAALEEEDSGFDRAAAESKVLKVESARSEHPKKPHKYAAKIEDDDSEDDQEKKSVKKDEKKPSKRGEPQRRQSKRIDIHGVLEADVEEEEESTPVVAILNNQRGFVPQPSLIKKIPPKKKRGFKKETTHIEREICLPESITVGELANRMAVRGADVIKKLMQMGTMANVNQVIDFETAELLVSEFGHKIKARDEVTLESVQESFVGHPEDMKPRPPVVTVMGHVDHGKTSLLDALRKTDVVGGEAGGITQHIGAYQVTMATGQKITFIDTPGHAAFSEMRSRGANVTDVIILVVAADDGIKEQTVEAINHAKAAGVPIIVAINKIDKPEANPDRVRQDLLSHELVVESMGGDVLEVEVSAMKGMNLDKLEEMILLQAELLDLKANPVRPAQGIIIESRMEKGRGIVSTILVQQGTLEAGQTFVAGATFGRVRSMTNDHGKSVKQALPSCPVEVTGFDAAPHAGDVVVIVSSEAQARSLAEAHAQKFKKTVEASKPPTSLDDLFAKALKGDLKELPIVVKTDVHGSMEALRTSLEKLSTDEVAVKIIHSGVGGINMSDMTLAQTSGAFILAFNVRAEATVKAMVDKSGVDIRHYAVIYDAINDVKALLGGLLAPIERENFLGYAEVRQVFTVSKVGQIAGCMITQGVVKRGCKVRILRDNIVIYEGNLKSLKRFKDEVKEAREGYECGIALENYNDIKEKDVIECFEVEQVARTLD